MLPLSPRLLTELRKYWKEVRSTQYLFPGRTFDVPLSSTTIQKTCRAAVQKAGMLKNITPHTLRHSYATGLLEAGVDTLRHEFRTRFLKGLRRLYAKGELKLEGDWSYLQAPDAFESLLAPLETTSWVTYIQPPPADSSRPEDVVKYLARYLTGGPISDHRVVAYDSQTVTFTARTGTSPSSELA